MMPITSGRLTMIASTATHVRTELETPERLADLLNATVSPAWPTGEYDRDAMEFFLARFEEGGADVEGWYGWYALSSESTDGSRALVGAGGYFGPPDELGTVEIGYSVLPEWQRRGYASEIVRILVENAFRFSNVNRIVARTTEENVASTRVLARCGFREAGAGAEPGIVCFECVRAASQ